MIRLIDIMCARHQQIVLEQRIWPIGYKPGDTTNCEDCRRVEHPPAYVRPFPRFGQADNEAIHECGHVVVALAHGFVVNYVALESSGRGGSTAHWSGRTTEQASINSAEFAEVTAAGEAAVRQWLLREGEDTAANLVDAAFGGLLDAEDLAAMTWRGTSQDALASADVLVAEHWPAIERVAEQLLSRGRLIGDEIADLAGMKLVR